VELAEVETSRRYAAVEPSEATCQRAETVATRFEQFVRADTTTRRRVEHRLRG
jgi:hypothetical protein